MANKRISELTTITGANLADADLLVVVDVSDTTMASSGTNKKITMAELAKDSALTDNLIAKSTLTTDGDVLTRAAGAPARITRADLAQDSAFSSRYVAKTEHDRVFVGAAAMIGLLSSPTLSYIVGGATALTNPVWLLDPDTSEYVSGSTVLPSHWSTFHVDIWWANASSSSGDVRWLLSGNQMVDTGQSDANTTGMALPAVTEAAPTSAGIVKVTRMATSVTRVADSMLGFSVWRAGTNGADTLANDCGLLGVMFVRAS